MRASQIYQSLTVWPIGALFVVGAVFGQERIVPTRVAKGTDPPPRLIVHALGMVDPFPIRNCRECFEASVKRGYTWLEADFVETADGGLAVTHDGLARISHR